MDPVTIAAIGALVIQGVSAIAGWISDENAADEEKQRRLAALQEYAALSPPEVRELIGQGVKESAFRGIQSDQGLRAVQEEAQQRLLDRGRNGASLAFRAEREEEAMRAAARARGNREAVANEHRQRGTWGSGEELLATLQGDSDAAHTERLAGVQQLAADEEAALQAMIAAGDMAGEREARDLDRQYRIASAEDDIAKFNAGVINEFNIYNDQQRWNKFQARLAIAEGKANAQMGLASSAARQGNNRAQRIGGAGQGLAYGVNAVGQYYGQQGAGNTLPVNQDVTPAQPLPGAGAGAGAGGAGKTGAQQRPPTQGYVTRKKVR